MGFATMNYNGMVGAGVQMVSHGVMTALFFAVVGIIYGQAHTRDLNKLGGMVKYMPIAEFPIFMGVWQSDKPWMAIVAAISIVITASYIFRLIRKVFFGDLPKELEGHIKDARLSEKIALGLLCLVLIGIGVFPSVIVPMVETGVQTVLGLLGG
jgi:NADH-quinone oxidoreductase subunit M